jgi:PAS domain S-box-containing protein
VLGDRLLIEQEATRRERDFNESLVATASSIILLLDPKGRIIFYNQSTAECLGYKLAEVEGTDWFEIFVPERDRLRARGTFEHCIENSLATGSQFAVVARDGRELQFSWSTKPMRDPDEHVSRLLFVGQDITTLLEAQRRLVASERLAAIGQTIAAVSHESKNELMAAGCCHPIRWCTSSRRPARLSAGI